MFSQTNIGAVFRAVLWKTSERLAFLGAFPSAAFLKFSWKLVVYHMVF